MQTVSARKAAISAKSRTGLEKWLTESSNLTLYRNFARIKSLYSVECGDQVLEAPQTFLNVGGRALVPDLPGLHDIPYWTQPAA